MRAPALTPAGSFASRRFALGALFAFACGPSLTSVHEGTVRFEHCHRLDLDEKVEKGACENCWQKWLNAYTYGQPRDRIDHARRRLDALSNGGERPVLDVANEPSQARQFYLVVPGPTSVHTPPPPIATVWQDRDAGAAPAEHRRDNPPAAACADKCKSAWSACAASCPDGGLSACPKCSDDYGACMRTCFD